jgi:tellurite resistance protein TerC
MPEISETTLWIGFFVFLLTVLSIDLLVFHRKTRVVSFNEALLWTVTWAVFALGFAGVLYVTPNMGPLRAQEFLTGYVLEQALSVDNLFVFVMIFASFAVPAAYQHRVLFWGILGAILLRGAFILAGRRSSIASSGCSTSSARSCSTRARSSSSRRTRKRRRRTSRRAGS